ncbi:hypothetical protein MMC13_005373 [Lambiella insularis]|nr:hypothetical protein [Lambiella insularis]
MSSSGMDENSSKIVPTIKLRSSDGVVVVVDAKAARHSEVIDGLLEDLGDEETTTEVVPIANVTGDVLRKVMEWCTHHQIEPPTVAEITDAVPKVEISEWDRNFFDVPKQDMLFDLINAANYLSIKGLLAMGCKTVANQMKGKSPEQIRQLYGVTNDFSPEEEEQIRRENAWAEDR